VNWEIYWSPTTVSDKVIFHQNWNRNRRNAIMILKNIISNIRRSQEASFNKTKDFCWMDFCCYLFFFSGFHRLFVISNWCLSKYKWFIMYLKCNYFHFAVLCSKPKIGNENIIPLTVQIYGSNEFLVILNKS